MKKKGVLLLLALMLSCFSLTACGNAAGSDQTSRPSRNSSAEDEDEDDVEDEGDADDEDVAANVDGLVYTGSIEDEGMADGHYELIIDGDKAIVREVYEDRGCETSTEHTGEYVFDEDKDMYTISSMDIWGDDLQIKITVDGDEIISYSTTYPGYESEDYDFSEIAGEYVAETECGIVSFEVEDSGLVDGVITIDGEAVEATLIIYGQDDDYDLMFEDLAGEYHDWYIYPFEATFSYEDYSVAVERQRQENYIKLAGDYVYSGPMGDITITISESGAATTLEIFGTRQQFSNGSVDFYDGEMDGVYFTEETSKGRTEVTLYLYDDDTYSCNITFSDNYEDVDYEFAN